jgi:hypothetical protein
MNNKTAREMFAEAAGLFRESESMFGDVKQDAQQANFCRALALLAEGLAKLSEEEHEAKSGTIAYRHPASIRPR